MASLIERLKGILAKFLAAYLPQRLPQTDQDLELFMAKVISIGGWPGNDSFRQAIAIQLQSIAPGKTWIRPIAFVHNIRTMIMKQAAYNIIEAARLEQKKRNEAKVIEPVQDKTVS